MVPILLPRTNSDGPFAIAIDWIGRDDLSPNVDYLIKTASAAIVQRMKANIQRSDAVCWGNHASFGKQSITLTASWREGDPLSRCRRGEACRGVQRGELVLRGRDGFRATIKSNVENFYPGFYFLLGAPPPAQPQEDRADVFEKPVRRVACFLWRADCSSVALATLSLPLLVPVDCAGISSCLAWQVF